MTSYVHGLGLSREPHKLFDDVSLFFEILCLRDYFILIYSCKLLRVSGSKRRGFPKGPLHTLRLLMDHKCDAQEAGLSWPNSTTRPQHGGPLVPGSTPPTTSSPPAWSLRQPSSSPTPVGHATYTPDDASHEESPFPASGPPLTDPTPRNYFTERTVHQVYFKIFTFADDRRELWVTENPANGYARTREPEQYFYFLTGDDAHARHTADYWRFFFNILTRHFDSPHYYWHHNLSSSRSRPAILYTFNYTNASGKHRNIGCPTSGTPLRPANIRTGPTAITSKLTSSLTIEQIAALTKGLQALASSSPSEM